MTHKKNSSEFLATANSLFRVLEQMYEQQNTDNSKLTKFLIYLIAGKLNEEIVDTELHHELGKKEIKIDGLKNFGAILSEYLSPKRQVYVQQVYGMQKLMADVLDVHTQSSSTYTKGEKDCLTACLQFCEFYLLKRPKLDSMHVHQTASVH